MQVQAQQAARPVPAPREVLGFAIGDDYHVAGYEQMIAYWKRLAEASDRVRLVDIGPTAEGRRQYMAVISSPENLRRLDHYREISRRLALAEGLTEVEARRLAAEGRAVVWIDGGLHASETVGSQQLIEMAYQMASGGDPETLRFLNDIILLCVPANPDGIELVASWYMREREPERRSLRNLPRLYHFYVGHDNNRDFYMSAMPETTNLNRQLFLEWFPQIVYNHHQSGPAGTVVFMPPFRDPFNYFFDPLVPLTVELVGAAMHARLVAAGLGGSVMRGAANYSTWYNGGLRTITYFHNMIGILTEIAGSPNPIEIPLVPARQLPSGDQPLPLPPQTWRYRQAIDYSISNNRAILDFASRYRETLLLNIWRMGMNSIEKGSRDNWTTTPRRIAELQKAAKTEPAAGSKPVPSSLYHTVLRDPAKRDPRGYILSAGQPDFATAVAFVNALLKTGIVVHRATADFEVAGKRYPAGSFVIKTAQAFRPHVLDMFEPQDHPNDFRYPGGPPIPPYDLAGWTLALQMGIEFDRILDGFEGPFERITGLLPFPARQIESPEPAAGFLLDHRVNNSFRAVNRLLGAGIPVYWLAGGDIWIPSSGAARSIIETCARELGVVARGARKAPSGEAWKIETSRIGLVDLYGGSITSGWTRWLLEQFEFPFQVVYPPQLDAGDLKSKYDVLIFTDGIFRLRGEPPPEPDPQSVPAEYRGRLGRITIERTLPQLRKFLESGGTLLAIGSSTALAEPLGLPVKNHLVERNPEGGERPLPREKFYIPGSLMRLTVNPQHPLAFGMLHVINVMFVESPVFRLTPDAPLRRTTAVGWFAGDDLLASGWAWGQNYLDGGAAVVESRLGEGKVILFGPEVLFRAQAHAAFKLFFNGLHFSRATPTRLP